MSNLLHPASPRLRAMLALLAIAAAPLAHAEVAEVEPNNTCDTAQAVGSYADTPVVDGEIASADVDYYTVTTSPDQWYEVEVNAAGSGAGTLDHPLLGEMDSTCTATVTEDSTGTGTDSLVLMKGDDTGSATFAVAGYGDWFYKGAPTSTGTYVLTAHAPTHSWVVGLVTDGNTGEPVSIDLDASIAIYSCTSDSSSSCTKKVNWWYTDDSGNYQIPLIDLTEGYYRFRLTASGSKYETTYSDVMELGPDSGMVTLNWTLEPVPVDVSIDDIVPCSKTSSKGICKFSYVLSNPTSSDMTVQVWGFATFDQTDSAVAPSEFAFGKGDKRKPFNVTLAAGASETITQKLSLTGLQSGTEGDVHIFVSAVDAPLQPLALAQAFGFTMTADGTADIMTAAQAQAFLKSHQRSMAGIVPPSRAGTAAVGDSDTFSGQVSFDDGRDIANLSLHRCDSADQTVCPFDTDVEVYTLPGGQFRFNMADVGNLAASYQVWTKDKDYDQTYSAPIQYVPGTSVSGVDLEGIPHQITISKVKNCDGDDASEVTQYYITPGSDCSISYVVSNNSSDTMTLDSWTTNEVSGAPIGSGTDTTYVWYPVAKKDGFNPVEFTLAPGETKKIKQALGMSSLTSGATNSVYLWVSKAGAPTVPLATWGAMWVYVVSP